MSNAACKQMVCAWNEIFTMPHGHALETILRHMCGNPGIAEGCAEGGYTDITIPILEKPQMTFDDMDAIRKVLKVIGEPE